MKSILTVMVFWTLSVTTVQATENYLGETERYCGAASILVYPHALYKEDGYSKAGEYDKIVPLARTTIETLTACLDSLPAEQAGPRVLMKTGIVTEVNILVEAMVNSGKGEEVFNSGPAIAHAHAIEDLCTDSALYRDGEPYASARTALLEPLRFAQKMLDTSQDSPYEMLRQVAPLCKAYVTPLQANPTP